MTDYFGFLDNVIKECIRVTKKHTFLNVQATFYNRVDIYSLIGKYSEYIQNIIVWGKENPMPASGTNVTNAYEFFIVIGEHPLKSNFSYTKNLIVTPVNSNMPTEHKAVMHPAVADWFIETFTSVNDIVLDPFMGTGTTALSCKKFNRNYIGFEISDKYCKMCEERLSGVEPATHNSLW